MPEINVFSPPPVTVRLDSLPRGRHFLLSGVVYVVCGLPVGGNMAVVQVEDGALVSFTIDTQVQALTLDRIDLSI